MSDVLSELASYVRSKSYKHTPYVSLHKAVIYGYLDKLTNELRSKSDPSKTACKQLLNEDDKHVAIETVDRLVRYAQAHGYLLTEDEAVNLRDIVYSVCEDNNDRK